MSPLAFPGDVRDPADATTPHISVSQAALVARCPLQWRFKYVDAIPAPDREPSDNWLLGVAIDRALAAYYTDPVHGGMAASMHLHALPERLHGRAETAWEQWDADFVSDLTAAPGGVQRRHTLPLVTRHSYGEPDLQVIGYSDLITTDGTLIDWKYGGKPNDAEWVRGVERQLRFYAYAETELHIRKALIVRFGGRELSVTAVDVYDAAGVADMIDWLYACAENGPNADYHAPTPGAHCGYCPYTSQCAGQLAGWARRLGNG